MNLTINPLFTFTETPGGGVLLDGKKGVYWQLNRTAAQIVAGLIRGESVSTVTSTLMGDNPNMGDDPKTETQIHADVTLFLKQLAEIGAVDHD